MDLECAASIVLPSWGPGGNVFLLRGLSLEGGLLLRVHLSADPGSFLFLACPPLPDSSSFHKVLTPVSLAAAGHPPSPQLVLMREWGGRLPLPPDQGLAG